MIFAIAICTRSEKYDLGSKKLPAMQLCRPRRQAPVPWRTCRVHLLRSFIFLLFLSRARQRHSLTTSLHLARARQCDRRCRAADFSICFNSLSNVVSLRRWPAAPIALPGLLLSLAWRIETAGIGGSDGGTGLVHPLRGLRRGRAAARADVFADGGRRSDASPTSGWLCGPWARPLARPSP